MPEADGYALIRQVRTLNAAAGGQIPAIALTAHARREDQTAAIEAGFQKHLAKPLEPNTLVAAIVRLMAQRQ